ncbi:MAG: hypothetical protein R2852_06885 [Bacteroidia bacterium]
MNILTINFKLFILLALTSCNQINKLPDKYKDGLLEFTVNPSKVTQDLKRGKATEFGALWIGFNRINIRKVKDTLIAEINVELTSTSNYDGGFELKGDTLFFYAKCLDKEKNKEQVHSTLTYKIKSSHLKYKEVEFKEMH